MLPLGGTKKCSPPPYTNALEHPWIAQNLLSLSLSNSWFPSPVMGKLVLLFVRSFIYEILFSRQKTKFNLKKGVFAKNERGYRLRLNRIR